MIRGGLCETCLRPGACCDDLHLTGGAPGRKMDEPMSHARAEHLAMSYGLPFRPVYQDERGVWRWTCYQLQTDGRCGVYDRRPRLCADYVAGSDPLCIHYHERSPAGEAAGA